jgi:PAS domain S-box-containing protein
MKILNKKLIFLLLITYLWNMCFPCFSSINKQNIFSIHETVTFQSIFAVNRNTPITEQEILMFKNLNIKENKILRKIDEKKYEMLIKEYYDKNFKNVLHNKAWENLDIEVKEIFLYMGVNEAFKDFLISGDTETKLKILDAFIKKFGDYEFVEENIEIILNILKLTDIKSNKFFEDLKTFMSTLINMGLPKEEDDFKYRYEALFNSSISGIAVYRAVDNGEDFVFVDFNKRSEELWDISKNKLLRRRVTDVFPGVRNLGLLDVFKRVWKTGKPEFLSNSEYKDNRVTHWVENSVYKLSTGEIVAIYNDLTEKKKLEDTILQEKIKYQTYIENAPYGVFVVDDKGKYIEVNAAACKVTGYSKEELLNMSIADLLAPESVKAGQEHFIKVKEKGMADGQFLFKHKNGTFYYMTVNAVKIKENMVIGFCEDITEKKEAEQELMKFKTMTEQSISGVAITDLKGNILYCNETWVRMHGYEKKEVIGQHLHMFHSQDQIPLIKNLFETLLEKGSFHAEEVGHRKKNGELFATLMNASVIKDNKGKPLFIETTMTDITDLILARKQVKGMSTLLSQVSHDTRTPLNAILGTIQLLEGLSLSSEAVEYIQTAKLAIETLLFLVDNILMYFKLKEHKLTLDESVVDIRKKLYSFYNMMNIQAKQKNIELKLIIDEKIPKYLICDCSRMQVILMNLTNNAIKFTDRGGTVTINVSLKQQINNKVILIFKVIDTGIGISKDVLNSGILFGEFIQIKGGIGREGFGLGLSIVKSLITLMNGKIWIQSDGIGKGSTISFELPLCVGTEISPSSSPDSSPLRGESTSPVRERPITYSNVMQKQRKAKLDLKILVVDDNKLNRELLKSLLLKKLGFGNIITANDGQEAVDYCKTNNYDIIFMDCQMPVMDGYEASAEILKYCNKNKRPIPIIIALTADALDGNKRKCESSGMRCFLTKPITMETLCKLINSFFDFTNCLDILIKDPVATEIRNNLNNLKNLENKNDIEIFFEQIDYLINVYKELTGDKISSEEIISEFQNVVQILITRPNTVVQTAVFNYKTQVKKPPMFAEYENRISGFRGKDKIERETLELMIDGMIVWKMFGLDSNGAEKILKVKILKAPERILKKGVSLSDIIKSAKEFFINFKHVSMKIILDISKKVFTIANSEHPLVYDTKIFKNIFASV